ncbi:MAG: carboxypeptidase regulatory-like domain-containing protein [Polyangiaceae bacterium]
MKIRPLLTSTTIATFSIFTALAACSGAKHASDFGGGDGGDNNGEGGTGLGGSGEGGPCVKLQCQQQACSGGGSTTVSGQILDPAGKTPLYNVIVYVPNAAVTAPDDGYATCDQCGSVASSPVVSVLSDTSGNFKLENVPVGKNIPIVVQVGKWQRQYTIPEVTACTDNPIDPDLTRLPKNSTEGHIPKIAVSTGGCDSLECFIRKIGVDASEFSNGGGAGRVQLYQGEGGSTIDGNTPRAYGSPTDLWDNPTALKGFDIVALTCECDEYGSDKSASALDNMRDYTNGGGRVFATHFHYYWFKNETASEGVASWGDSGQDGDSLVDTSFPKGSDFADWLQNIHATTTRGKIDITDTASPPSIKQVNPADSTRWIYQGTGSTYQTQYMTFNTPVGSAPADQCGRVVLSDIHVETEDAPSGGSSKFPALCQGGTLTAQEQALEFLFFDLNACVQSDSVAPAPPR